MSRDWSCYWCEIRIYKFSKYCIKFGLKRGDKPPHNLFTRDNIFNKLEPKRKINKEWVPSCFKCNQERGAVDCHRLHKLPWKVVKEKNETCIN